MRSFRLLKPRLFAENVISMMSFQMKGYCIIDYSRDYFLLCLTMGDIDTLFEVSYSAVGWREKLFPTYALNKHDTDRMCRKFH
jgi:hypothetical protein